MKTFQDRHIGLSSEAIKDMLAILGFDTVQDLVKDTVPNNIQLNSFDVCDAMSEAEFLTHMTELAAKNVEANCFIGQGYYPCHVPSPIKRNILENPGWYTQYTPYQAEISQGRLEALINFQTMVSDLTGLPIANASLLDEGTAAAEGMTMLHHAVNKRLKEKKNTFLVDEHAFTQTKNVIETRARLLDIKVQYGSMADLSSVDGDVFACLIQYPNSHGEVYSLNDQLAALETQGIPCVVASDLLALTMLESPGHLGADVVVGNSQRFGVPMGYGGPHAAYFACKEKYKRQIPGRIIGISKDSNGKLAYRMALQTREQHIRRDKATSNICTAQALLAIMAGAYAVYHGPDGLTDIATHCHTLAGSCYNSFVKAGIQPVNQTYFDTITVKVADASDIKKKAESQAINLFYQEDGSISITFDETKSSDDVAKILGLFGVELTTNNSETGIPQAVARQTDFLTHEVFNSLQTETELMRYLKRLENKDFSLTHSMIPLGSCTMKLNAASELYPVSMGGFSNIHPMAPASQTVGYAEMIASLENYLANVTGFAGCSLQPNSGAQGEFTGLVVIRAYHEANGDLDRNIMLIPSSAHGTNPASAVMTGFQVKVVKCDERGNIDMDDLKAKSEQYKDTLGGLMITYPSTHGVFESTVKDICQIIHDHGGMVYMDGANMNAQVGYTNPGHIGADVCHLNLHKTFAIPHGGGGPGMGPICVNEKLLPFLPEHSFTATDGALRSVSSAPYGSASILPISYGYIKMLGTEGLKKATEIAILNANYIKQRLEGAFDVLYTDEHGHVAHELIVDLRAYKEVGIQAEDVAKRLMDYGFHAPTLSFPVAGTIMIEPTESESKAELDRFCDALLQIKEEINEVAAGTYPADNNVLVNAPHTEEVACGDDWHFPYNRSKAVYPLPYLKEGRKIWPKVGRIDNAYGDRNLICTCADISEYEDETAS